MGVPDEICKLLHSVRRLGSEYNHYRERYFRLGKYWVRARPTGDLMEARLVIREGKFPYKKLVHARFCPTTIYKLDKGFLPELLKLKSTLDERLNFRKQIRQSSDAEWKEALK